MLESDTDMIHQRWEDYTPTPTPNPNPDPNLDPNPDSNPDPSPDPDPDPDPNQVGGLHAPEQGLRHRDLKPYPNLDPNLDPNTNPNPDPNQAFATEISKMWKKGDIILVHDYQ